MIRIINLTLCIFCILCCEPNDDNGLKEQNDPDTSTVYELDLPDRESNAMSGSELIQWLRPKSLDSRENAVLGQVLGGNIPGYIRQLKPITYSELLDSVLWNITLYVTPDYFTIGSDEDPFLIPMTPILAQKIADTLGVSLVTRKIADKIWIGSDVKMEPQPIPPSDAMTTVPVFADHNAIVQTQRNLFLDSFTLGSIVAGHKKDVILSNRIAENPTKVVIYGWHYQNGQPIQPIYSGHVIWYADYSHGIRYMADQCELNGTTWFVEDLLKHPSLYKLLSDESGAMTVTRYLGDDSNYP